MSGAPVKRLAFMSVRQAVVLWGDSWRIGREGLRLSDCGVTDDDADGFVMDDAARLSAAEGRRETMRDRASYGLSLREQFEAGL